MYQKLYAVQIIPNFCEYVKKNQFVSSHKTLTNWFFFTYLHLDNTTGMTHLKILTFVFYVRESVLPTSITYHCSVCISVIHFFQIYLLDSGNLQLFI